MIHFWLHLPTDSIHCSGNHSARIKLPSILRNSQKASSLIPPISSFTITLGRSSSPTITHSHLQDQLLNSQSSQTHPLPLPTTTRNNYTYDFPFGRLALSIVPSLTPLLPILESSLHPYTFPPSVPTLQSSNTRLTLYFIIIWPCPARLSYDHVRKQLQFSNRMEL